MNAVSPLYRSARPRGGRALAAAAVLWCGVAAGCWTPTQGDVQQENRALREALRKRESELAAQATTIEQLHRQLTLARGLSDDDLKKIFYPERLEIDRLSGGADYDGRPGDDGVTVHLRPIDRDGDVIKVAGDIRIQLFDLAAPPDRNLIGEYTIPADQVGKLWHGKLLTGHYTIKCPWPGLPPENPVITIRAVFVDYFTRRVVSAQAVCQVKLAPR